MAMKIEDLPDDVALLKAMILARRNEADAARAETARIDAEHARLAREHAALADEVDRLTAQNERLDHIIAVLRRAQFGRSSERISDDQLNLALEDVETAHGADDAKAEQANDIVRREGIKGRRTNRGKLPAHLPREEMVIAPEDMKCPCCGGDLHVIGEDVSERLDKVPAKLKVIVTRRPKFACRACEKDGADKTAGVIRRREAMRYGLGRWKGLTRFLADGRIEIDTNVVKRSIRPIALNRKNALFAGSDDGGVNRAIIASVIETAKLNGINPHA